MDPRLCTYRTVLDWSVQPPRARASMIIFGFGEMQLIRTFYSFYLRYTLDEGSR